MPRRKSAENELATMYADVEGIPSREALMAKAGQTLATLTASSRPDLAGNPLNLTSVPMTYQQKVLRQWDAYGYDPLFKRLIDRVVEFNANGSQWEIPSDNTETSWIARMLKRMEPDMRDKKLGREEDFWNQWSSEINTGVPNVLPGLDQITAWMTRHMLLSGMFVPHWKLGPMRIGKQTYIVPKQLTCYPASSITLLRENSEFMNERALYFRVANMASSMMEGQSAEAPNFMNRGGSIPKNATELTPMHDDAEDGETESFVLKYSWSPGDIVGQRQGSVQRAGSGIYPQPPFNGLLPQFAIRQKLFHADLSVLDGIINFIMQYQIGDKDHPPKPPEYRADGTVLKDGTIATVRKLIQEGRVGPAMELFLPYYVNLKVIQPDPQVLLNDSKYGASATEIMAAFNILYARTAAGSRERFQDINTSGFEEFVGGIRAQCKAFWQMMASHIMMLNKGKLLGVPPQWSPNPLNTKTDSFMQELVKLKSIGAVSLRTLLRYHGLDDGVELRRITQELETDVDDVLNENVPLSFVQQTIQPDSGGNHPKMQEDPPGGGKGGTNIPTSPGKPTVTGRPIRDMKIRKQHELSKTRQPGRPPK